VNAGAKTGKGCGGEFGSVTLSIPCDSDYPNRKHLQAFRVGDEQ